MKGKVALVIIFNHRFDRNIPVLEQVYKGRFSNIYFLVPFYDGEKTNVIPVYENSFYFQGYISQGFKHYFHDDFEHYFFVADDMVLNPEVNENNYQQFFNLPDNASYIPEIFTLNNFSNNETLLFSPYYGLTDRLMKRLSPGKNLQPAKRLWWRITQGISYDPQKEGVESSKEIPPYDEAVALLRKHGFEMQPLEYIDINGGCPFPLSARKAKQFIKYTVNQKMRKRRYHLKYPMVASYSDIVIVPASTIKKFIHYCGVFAATELFVEFAIPTALLLSSGKVVCEPDIGKRGLVYWLYSDDQKATYEQEMSNYGYNLDRLIENFPAGKLYIHPIKLSKWKTEKI